MNHGITNVIIKLLDREMKKPRQGKENLVYLSPVLLWVGIVCTGLFLIPGLLVPLFTGEWAGEYLFFLAFAVFSSSLVVAYINCRIWYTEEEFTVRNFLGIRRTFRYEEIESIQGSHRDVILKVRGRTVRIDEAAVGKLEFLRLAKKRYRTAHGGNPIPEIKKSKWDIFNGHVDNPGEFLVGYGFMLLFMPAAFLLCFFLSEPTPMEEMTFVTAPIVRMTVAEDDKTDLVLLAAGTEMEIWGYQHTLSDAEAFLAAGRAGEVFTIGYRVVRNDEKEVTGLSAEYIEDTEGKVWLTPRAAYNNRFREVSIIFGIFEVVWIAIVAASVYVGRNPSKFSKKVIRLFFKDGYVH